MSTNIPYIQITPYAVAGTWLHADHVPTSTLGWETRRELVSPVTTSTLPRTGGSDLYIKPHHNTHSALGSHFEDWRIKYLELRMFLKQKKFAFSLLFCIHIVNFTLVAKRILIIDTISVSKIWPTFRGINGCFSCCCQS